MLTLLDREEISRGLAEGLELKQIAARIGRDRSVISREVGRHGGRAGYRAVVADEVAAAARARPKKLAVERSPRLRAIVSHLLRKGWSPASIAGRLPIDYPDDQACRVSHEGIYQWIYAQPVATLARELIGLRTGRTTRRGGRRPPPAPRIREPVYIDARPADAAGRAVPGHWEGDLVFGKHMSPVATLVERSTRFVMLVALPSGNHKADVVADALAAAIQRMPAQLAKSLTWDQGHEMAQHARFTAATGVEVYFCDPKSPWQRGSNENTNGLLRQYLPKTLDFRTLTQDDFDAIALELNQRPRQTLGFKSPSQALAEVLR
jgi:IS30 family transposase